MVGEASRRPSKAVEGKMGRKEGQLRGNRPAQQRERQDGKVAEAAAVREGMERWRERVAA